MNINTITTPYAFRSELQDILQNLFVTIIGEPITIHITPQGQVQIVKPANFVNIIIPGFQYAQLRSFQTSHNPFLQLTADHVNTIMNTLNMFWNSHEDVFLYYLALLSFHKDAIAVCSLFLCGVNLSTLHMAQVTWARVQSPTNFIDLWSRHIITYGKQANFQHVVSEQQVRLEVTTLQHYIHIHILFLNTSVQFYFKLASYEQIHFLQHQYPLFLSEYQVNLLQLAWRQHRILFTFMQKLQTRHISHSRSIDNSPIPIQSLASNTMFYSVWPFAKRIRKTFPQEFKTISTTWCMESTPTANHCSIVVPLTSFTKDTLMRLFSIPHFQLSVDEIEDIHKALNQLWLNHECLFIQYIHSQRNKFIQFACLTQWCEQTFGMDMTSLESAQHIKNIAIQRINSIYNTLLATLQNPNQSIRFFRQQFHWNKKLKVLKINTDDDVTLEFHLDPLPSWPHFHAIFNQFPFATSQDQLLEHQIQNIYQEFQSFCINEQEN